MSYGLTEGVPKFKTRTPVNAGIFATLRFLLVKSQTAFDAAGVRLADEFGDFFLAS